MHGFVPQQYQSQHFPEALTASHLTFQRSRWLLTAAVQSCQYIGSMPVAAAWGNSHLGSWTPWPVKHILKHTSSKKTNPRRSAESRESFDFLLELNRIIITKYAEQSLDSKLTESNSTCSPSPSNISKHKSHFRSISQTSSWSLSLTRPGPRCASCASLPWALHGSGQELDETHNGCRNHGVFLQTCMFQDPWRQTRGQKKWHI